MSSSGKGQSLVKSADELEHAWEYGCSGSRGDIRELIIEEFIKFDSEITLLTVTQKNGPTLFCPPIGHVQKGGDYRESFQPAHIDPAHLKEAEEMAEKVTRALTGAGLWGVEFFLSHENGVYFSELSPRPHDTGMVTLAGTQNLNEFELHLRAVLGLPIPGIKQERIGASAVILSPIAQQERPQYRGLEEVTKEEDTYLRIFGKPFTRVNRRMGVVLCYAPFDADLDADQLPDAGDHAGHCMAGACRRIHRRRRACVAAGHRPACVPRQKPDVAHHGVRHHGVRGGRGDHRGCKRRQSADAYVTSVPVMRELHTCSFPHPWITLWISEVRPVGKSGITWWIIHKDIHKWRT